MVKIFGNTDDLPKDVETKIHRMIDEIEEKK